MTSDHHHHHRFLPPALQQYSRSNGTAQANSLKDLLQNKIDDMEKQVLSRVNTLEGGKPGQRNDTDQRNKVESTLTSLHHRITDLEKGTLFQPEVLLEFFRQRFYFQP